MSEPCCHNLLCSCRRNCSEIVDDVKNKIEDCIQMDMSLEETLTNLQENHNISHHLTKLIWECLQKENPNYFKGYYLKLELAHHMKMWNGLLGKQTSLMLEHGLLDVIAAPAAIMNFLCQDLEGTRLVEKLANTSSDRSEVNPSSLAMLALADTNGPTVKQLPIPNDQQNDQFHHSQCSTTRNDLACNDPGAPTVAPPTTDQWFTSTDFTLNQLLPNGQQNQLQQDKSDLFPIDFTCNNVGAHPIAPAATNQWPTSNGLAYNGAPTVTQAPTVPFYLGDSIEDNGPIYQIMNPFLLEILTQSECSLQDPDGQYQQQLQLQQKFSLEELQNVESNSGLQYGRDNNELQGVTPQQHPHHNHEEQETIQAKRDRQNQIPGYEASNNPNSGDSTLTKRAQNQHDLQRQQQRRGL